MARLQLSVKGVDWAASLVQHRQHDKVDGEWSAHEHVFHLLGNEKVFQERIRRCLSEDAPAFERWDSQAHMRAHTSEPDIGVLAERFMAERAATVELLKALTEDQWFRTATWPDGRKVDLAWIAEKVLWHALDHFAFLLDLHGDLEPLQAPGWRAAPG